ncbi:hypothetical protein LTR95_007605 [Oleoguttula sp. CCFEE 5521]
MKTLICILWLISIVDVALCDHNVVPAAFGIGYTLHFDYGSVNSHLRRIASAIKLTAIRVAAIYYTNGSSNGIAKIEGSLAYKHLMRKQTWQLPEPYGTEPIRPQYMSWYYTGCYKQGLRHYLPPWLSDIQPDARTDVLAPMLAALTAAFVAHAGTNNTEVFVTFAAQPQSEFVPVVAAAAARSGVSMPFLRNDSPAGFVADAYGLSSDPCYDVDASRVYDPMQLLLVVDCSRAAISASLRGVWCGMDKDLRTMMNTSLEVGTWSEEVHRSLVVDLRRFLRPVVANWEGHRLDRIEKVVLSGESALDERLRAVLREVVEDSVMLAVSDAVDSEKGSVDPLFAAAIGAASHFVWVGME